MGFVFSVPSQEIGWEERLRNDIFCDEWDVKLCSVLKNLQGFLHNLLWLFFIMAAILWYHIMSFCVHCQRTVSHFLMSRVLSVHWTMTLSRWWAHWAWVRGNPCQTQSSLRSPTRLAQVWWPVQTAAVPWWVRMLIFFRFCPVLFGYWVCNWYCFMVFSAVLIVFLCLHLT